MNQTTLTSLTIAGVSAISLLGTSAPAIAAAIGVDWGTPTIGELNGSPVFLSNINDPVIATLDLSGSDFSAAPLSSSQETIAYGVNSDWTATFSDPVSDLLLYPVFWRGSGAGGPDPVTYEFNQPFTILSGLTGATVVGNTLSVPQSGTFSGVIQFTGPVNSLTVNTSATGLTGQVLTFGVNDTPPPVSTPEPATILGLLAVGSLATLSRKGKA
ncbi:MAG: PEP-CTERM sorting domain-containing protein [Crocosphaera sp.]